jgi:ABC-type nitrate/sulfonate/bicarbonate transport system permease component
MAIAAREVIGTRAIQLGFVAGVAGLWYYATHIAGVSHLFLPKIGNVADELTKLVLSGAIIAPLRVTLLSVAVAYLIAAVTGIAAGYLVARSAYLVRVFEPVLTGMFAIPITLFFPLFVLYFGIGAESKVAYGAVYGFFPIALNTIAGFGHVDRRLIESARSMGASDALLFRRVLLPAAFPVILTGLRIGFFICFASVLGGETLLSRTGLGHQIAYAAELMESARMYAWIVLVIAISASLNAVVSRIEARQQRWRE